MTDLLDDEAKEGGKKVVEAANVETNGERGADDDVGHGEGALSAGPGDFGKFATDFFEVRNNFHTRI